MYSNHKITIYDPKLDFEGSPEYEIQTLSSKATYSDRKINSTSLNSFIIMFPHIGFLIFP